MFTWLKELFNEIHDLVSELNGTKDPEDTV
jgi:hypothetical protein